MHYFIIGTIILVIIYFQVSLYRNTKKRTRIFKSIFPESVEETYSVYRKDRDGAIVIDDKCESLNKEIQQLNDKEKKNANKIKKNKDTIDLLNDDLKKNTLEHEIVRLNSENKELKEKRNNLYRDKESLLKRIPQNFIWDKILKSINIYLEKNKGSVSDFHLIKDIVDRNCDVEEDAIQTQVPMPLYYGLMGTMAGIIVGVGYLWLSGGLTAILSTSPNATNTATDGIVALLGGVALAMICSIIGIILTTTGSSKLKDAKISVEERKHEFLSWMQAELLPKLNNDIADVLSKVTSNLTEFNETFSDNAEKLHYALNEVNKATDGQTQLLTAIDKLKISRIASANIEVYDKLKACTDEIGLIAEQLQSSRAYLQEVRTLNEKLDSSEQRTRTIEDMAEFFKNERSNLVAMQSVLNIAIGDIQTNLKDSIESLKETSSKQITELVAHMTEQRQRLQSAIDEQDKVLEQKTTEINRLIANLSSVEKMVQTLDASAKKQSQAISALGQDIRDLAMQKASGTVTVKREALPRWSKALIIAGGSIVSLYCLISLILSLGKLVNAI